MYVILGLLIGFAVIFTTIINGKLAERVGTVNGIKVNYMVATLASILLMIILGEKLPQSSTLVETPIYYYFGGLFGLAMIFSYNIIVPRIPAVYIVLIPFLGQILTSSIIDYFILDVFSEGKVFGGILIFIGLLYNIRVDKKYENSESAEV